MLIQIVPSLPPVINGVGDYALTLAHLLRQDFGLDTQFLVGNDKWQGPEILDNFRVSKLPSRSARDLEVLLDSLRTTTDSSSVLLHLSVYGYALRGCPFWLLDGLKRFKSKRPDSRLVTMFHELYAFGPPWSSAFWLSLAQQKICAGVSQLSDAAVTNLCRYRDRIERFDSTKRQRIPVLAIPSNVGEPLVPVDLDSRCKSMIVFGQPPLRNRTYKTQMSALQQACQRLGITEIHDVGAPIDGLPERVGNVRITKHGQMDASDLSSLLSNSVAGFLDYYPGYLAKSGVFAAYCAHRLTPVAPIDNRSDADGIASGIHYYSVQDNTGAALGSPNAQSIADAAWNWYQGHSLNSHAITFAEILQN